MPRSLSSGEKKPRKLPPMSQEEQDKLVGALTREVREISRDVAAIEAKLGMHASFLSELAGRIMSFSGKPRIIGVEHADMDAFVMKMPGAVELSDLLVDLRNKRGQRDELKARLAALG